MTDVRTEQLIEVVELRAARPSVEVAVGVVCEQLHGEEHGAVEAMRP